MKSQNKSLDWVPPLVPFLLKRYGRRTTMIYRLVNRSDVVATHYKKEFDDYWARFAQTATERKAI